MKLHLIPVIAALAVAGAVPAFAQAQKAEKTLTVGGAPMYLSKTFVEYAFNSMDHTNLVDAVKEAGYVDTLYRHGLCTY